MGFTPLEGLMMGSRSGSIDPGIMLYLLQQKKVTVEQLDETLNKASGLKGISGSGDMRKILRDIKENKPRAKLAFDMFVHRLRYYIGAMLATLGGLDALVFTDDIVENADEARQATYEPYLFLEITHDDK